MIKYIIHLYCNNKIDIESYYIEDSLEKAFFFK